MADGKKISELTESASIEDAHYFAVSDGTETKKVAYGTIKNDLIDYSEDMAEVISPTITATEIDGGHKLTIQDFNGTSTVNVMDGAVGPRGPQGLPGPQGETGSFDDLTAAQIQEMASYVVNDACIRAFDTVADMQAAVGLTAGMVCHTNGFYSAGDGGAAYYTISASGTANGMDVLSCAGGLLATYVKVGQALPRQFGAEQTQDAHDAILCALKYGNLFLDADYLTSPIKFETDKNLVVNGNGHKLTHYGNSGFAVLWISPTASIDVTITDMTIDGNYGVANGLWIRHDADNADISYSGIISIERCTFSEFANHATSENCSGVSVFTGTSIATIVDCVVSDVRKNYANAGVIAARGINIYNSAAATVSGCIVKNINDGVDSQDQDGVALFNCSGVATLRDSVLVDCETRFVKSQNTNVNVKRCSFTSTYAAYLDVWLDFQSGYGDVIGCKFDMQSATITGADGCLVQEKPKAGDLSFSIVGNALNVVSFDYDGPIKTAVRAIHSDATVTYLTAKVSNNAFVGISRTMIDYRDVKHTGFDITIDNNVCSGGHLFVPHNSVDTSKIGYNGFIKIVKNELKEQPDAGHPTAIVSNTSQQLYNIWLDGNAGYSEQVQAAALDATKVSAFKAYYAGSAATGIPNDPEGRTTSNYFHAEIVRHDNAHNIFFGAVLGRTAYANQITRS